MDQHLEGKGYALDASRPVLIGISVDPERNAAYSGATAPIHRDGARVQVLVVPTNEELEIAVQTEQLIGKRP